MFVVLIRFLSLKTELTQLQLLCVPEMSPTLKASDGSLLVYECGIQVFQGERIEIMSNCLYL